MKIIRWFGSALFTVFGCGLFLEGVLGLRKPDVIEGRGPKIGIMLFGALLVLTGIVLAVDTYRQRR